MSENKKIHYGDHLHQGAGVPPTPPEGRFTFDSMDIDFSSMIETFDEI